jgi:hypothetical protein
MCGILGGCNGVVGDVMAQMMARNETQILLSHLYCRYLSVLRLLTLLCHGFVVQCPKLGLPHSHDQNVPTPVTL